MTTGTCKNCKKTTLPTDYHCVYCGVVLKEPSFFNKCIKYLLLVFNVIAIPFYFWQKHSLSAGVDGFSDIGMQTTSLGLGLLASIVDFTIILGIVCVDLVLWLILYLTRPKP